MSIDESGFATRLVSRVAEEAEDDRLETARIIIAGGRGPGGPEGFKLLEELASSVGGAVGASRVACDLGWCPHSRQIGMSGKTVTPDLYVAVGISGASHHMAGCGTAKAILAINSDPDAAIFREARFGIVSDYKLIIPALIEALTEGDPCGVGN
ncbi:MAG: electron transfer flavoprotein subunit alpha/FixB family protein [Gammaproteobacteria bacterium]|nr:electron transfer flavoprotein subunit alpha/FixB family protein [Gammaproteobacteria bacterium]